MVRDFRQFELTSSVTVGAATLSRGASLGALIAAGTITEGDALEIITNACASDRVFIRDVRLPGGVTIAAGTRMGQLTAEPWYSNDWALDIIRAGHTTMGDPPAPHPPVLPVLPEA